MGELETVRSTDGTPIAFWRQGSGSPILLVHGGICDHLAWHFVASLLAGRHTVFAYDRRGRGRSGDTSPHTVHRELEDIQAMLQLIGAPAHVLGHSAGAILAVTAAISDIGIAGSMRSLILYDPPFLVQGARERPQPDVLAGINELLARGDIDGALRVAMRESAGVTDAAMDAMQAGPGWEHLRGAARAIPYDWKVWEVPFSESGAAVLQMPVLLLLGSESPAWIRMSTERVYTSIPHAQMVLLEGQGHAAMMTEPDQFSRTVLRFIESLP